MTYARRLTVALRSRQAEEARIAEVLREVDGLGMSDPELEQELGTPENYAVELVPVLPSKKKAGPIITGGVVAALAWLAWVFVGVPLGWWTPREELRPLLLVPALVVLGLSIVGEFASSYFRKPRA
ncbi:hypothetical protein [Oerskovia turbata]